ncbi:hypothetical protein Tco_1199097 [Tanacetum coccineum]
MIILDNNVKRSRSQSTRTLVNFWYLCENQHPNHDAIAKARPRIPKLKWRTTTNHVDCGVFAMIHMECYIGEPDARCDVGLYKMFDLAYKFETDNDELTRILIIVNAIKKRVERDLVKHVVENQEGDAAENVVEHQEGGAVK